MARADRGIEGVADLSGTRIGYPTGAQVEFSPSRFLAFADITASAAEIVDMPPSRMALVESGRLPDFPEILDSAALSAVDPQAVTLIR